MHPDWQNKIHQYCEKYSSKESDFLQDVTSFTWRNTINARQLSGHLQGLVLSTLVNLKKPHCLLEIGSFTGYSTACFASNLSDLTEIHVIEADQEILYKAKTFWQDYDFMQKINWHCGEGLLVFPSLDIEPDFVFIDADKKNYLNYFNLIFPKLKSGGLMLFDNTLWSGKVIQIEDGLIDKDTQIMHAFNEKLSECTYWKTVILPIRDGLTLVTKN